MDDVFSFRFTVYPYSSLSAAMNPANSEAAAAGKARHKDKKQRRKKRMDPIKDDCGAATAEDVELAHLHSWM